RLDFAPLGLHEGLVLLFGEGKSVAERGFEAFEGVGGVGEEEGAAHIDAVLLLGPLESRGGDFLAELVDSGRGRGGVGGGEEEEPASAIEAEAPFARLEAFGEEFVDAVEEKGADGVAML